MKSSLRFRAVSSVVEHYLDMVGVTGSNPVPRTTSVRDGIGIRVSAFAELESV
jgi:hypothetical protein